MPPTEETIHSSIELSNALWLVGTPPAVRRRYSLDELKRPAGVGVLLRCPGGFVGSDVASRPAFLDRILLGLRVA